MAALVGALSKEPRRRGRVRGRGPYALGCALGIEDLGFGSRWLSSSIGASQSVRCASITGVAAPLAVIRSTSDWIFDLGALAAAIGTVAAVFVLILQNRQTRQELHHIREATLGTHFDATAQRILDLDAIFLDRPELRTFIYRRPDGTPAQLPEHSSDKREDAEAIAEYVIDMLDTELLRGAAFLAVNVNLPDFEPWIRDLIAYSEPFCYVLATSWEWYSLSLLGRYAEMADRGRAAWMPDDEKTWLLWLGCTPLPEKWGAVLDR